MTLGSWAIAPVLEVRARGEYRHDLDDQDRGLVVERARLGADAVGGPVEARVVFQDAHAVDLTPGTEIVSGPSPTAVTGVYEAWGDVHSTGLRPSFLRIGRQAVTWGEGRLLGTADWTATGRSLDAVRGSVTFGDGSAEVLAAILTDNPTGASLAAYGELFGARFGWAFDPLFKAEAFAFARVVQSEPVETLDMSVRGETYTGSVRLYGDSFAWTWGAEGAFQLGHAADLSLDRQAWAAAGHVARVFDRVVFTPALQLGAAYASGDHGGSTYGTFDPLLPDVHVWHGAMDLFAWSNEGEGNARVSATPFYDGVVAVEYRYARLAQADGPWRTSYLTTVGSAPGNLTPTWGTRSTRASRGRRSPRSTSRSAIRCCSSAGARRLSSRPRGSRGCRQTAAASRCRSRTSRTRRPGSRCVEGAPQGARHRTRAGCVLRTDRRGRRRWRCSGSSSRST